MKIEITVPDSANYGALHQFLAVHLGQGANNGFNLPIAIEQSGCTTHPSNYHVLFVDHNEAHDHGWRVLAVLKFKKRPFEPVTGAALDKDKDDQQTSQWEDEERAIFAALAETGHHFRPATGHSSYSPTGRMYAEGPIITAYAQHITVTQSGGLDC